MNRICRTPEARIGLLSPGIPGLDLLSMDVMTATAHQNESSITEMGFRIEPMALQDTGMVATDHGTGGSKLAVSDPLLVSRKGTLPSINRASWSVCISILVLYTSLYDRP
jgi:hypothetical protein